MIIRWHIEDCVVAANEPDAHIQNSHPVVTFVNPMFNQNHVDQHSSRYVQLKFP
jgi:hypothetical protein